MSEDRGRTDRGTAANGGAVADGATRDGAAGSTATSGDATGEEWPATERDAGDGGAATAETGGPAGEPATAETPGSLAATTVRAAQVRATDHWVGIGGLTFLTAGLGVLTGSQALVLAAVVGVSYLAYAAATEAPEPSLAVGRRVADPDPDPGDEVEVTVAVANVGDELLADLRIVEQVPEALAVVDGPARTATALRPGARATFSYTVEARRGTFEFEGLTVLSRNASGSRERELDLATAEAGMRCLPGLDATAAVPLHGMASPYTGRVPTDTSGEGIEFASMREYEHGDPLSRIDWNHYARVGELATKEFREERMATVVVLLDLRRVAYLGTGEGPNAVDRGIDAARRLFNSLLDTGDRVGLAALSPGEVWLAPGAGPTHRAQARELFGTHEALSPTPTDKKVYVRGQVRDLTNRLDDHAQVVFVSPVPDEAAAYAARAVRARDHPVTVVSPDPTGTDTHGHRIAHVQRDNRLAALRASGVRVVDWTNEETLAEALERARRRWSA